MASNTVKLAGIVKELIDRLIVDEPQQAQIQLAGADFLYDELRIPNIHQWKVGTGIEITIRPLQPAVA